ncbi:MAG: ABC transporter ATP-binding protein, partial [Lachnospiraceae bacterium]|nr:ABC transporter ATP-binding protein [Lachnospiraceae bacterium]
PVITRFKELLSVNETSIGKLEKKAFNTSIEVKNVDFSYEENKVLDNVSVSFKKNGKYAVTGHSGSGKSTLINIIMGLIKPDNGEVLYDGININELSDTDRADIISIVPQDTFLFNDTIRNNVTLFRSDITEDSIIKALKKADIWTLVEGLPEGLDTIVAENGKNFSGGEKQRFALARAYLKNTPILVLDEGTSAIDAETARAIEDKLIEDKELTLIAITHDVSDEHLKRFDNVIRIK